MAVLKRKTRRFLPEDFKITIWEALEPYFNELLSKELTRKSVV